MFYPDYADVHERGGPQEVRGAVGAPLSGKSGLTVVEIINAAYGGEIQRHVYSGREPCHVRPRPRSCARRHRQARASRRAGHLPYGDGDDGRRRAPGSAWPEKNGTVTNTNRQVQMGRKALDLPGDTRDDLWIIVELAKRLGLNWTYTHPAEVFAEMKLAMPSLDNITWERLERESSIIYPCPEPDHPGDAIVFGRRFPDGVRPRQSRCRRCAASGRGARPRLPLGADDGAAARALAYGRHDAARRECSICWSRARPRASTQRRSGATGFVAGQLMRVTTRRGSIELTARADRHVQEGTIFIPFAYVEAAANVLTNPQLDPIRQDSRSTNIAP